MSIKPKSTFSLTICLLVFVIQLISLFRTLPADPACGKVQSLGHGAHVLINCDSAVFMKDAQNPKRLFNGQSVYQDRPLYASLNWLISTPLIHLGVPNKEIVVTGNSGVPTSYSEIFYLTYLLINFCILMLAVFLMIKWVKTTGIWREYRTLNLLIIANLLLILTANELTKTYFWTPHSQMFNLLLPCYALYLGAISGRLCNRRTLYFHATLIGIGLLFYSLLGILYYFIVTASGIRRRIRIQAVLFSLIPWLLFPLSVKALGGTYRSIALSKYRLFIWLLDGIQNRTFFQDIIHNGRVFLRTLPVTPLIIVFLSAACLSAFGARKFTVHSLVKSEKIRFSLLYFTFFAALGYYARRVTLGPIVFIELLLFSLVLNGLKGKWDPYIKAALLLLFVFQLGSWVFTMGPME